MEAASLIVMPIDFLSFGCFWKLIKCEHFGPFSNDIFVVIFNFNFNSNAMKNNNKKRLHPVEKKNAMVLLLFEWIFVLLQTKCEEQLNLEWIHRFSSILSVLCWPHCNQTGNCCRNGISPYQYLRGLGILPAGQALSILWVFISIRRDLNNLFFSKLRQGKY